MIEKISKEHRELFPMADYQSQKEKLAEEKNEALKELVDVAIVSAGIYRFNKEEGLRVMEVAYKACELLGFKRSDLDREIDRKWQVNLKRVWKWYGTTYHHIGED